jgi:2-amino-4-hydroxy-6-hydroxymethyldihydropteridine diphosphokinase
MSHPVRASQVRAYIALGSNLGEPLRAVESGFESLAGLAGCRLAARSSLYRSAPVGVGPQPDFINAVAALDTSLGPRELLTALLDVEARHGRTRHIRLAARTLDLDLLLHGDTVADEPELQLPHPRMHLRAFVLLPLAEIAPELVIPGLGPVAGLLPAVADQIIVRL